MLSVLVFVQEHLGDRLRPLRQEGPFGLQGEGQLATIIFGAVRRWHPGARALTSGRLSSSFFGFFLGLGVLKGSKGAMYVS